MSKLKLPDEIQEKLERTEALRWVVDRDDPHKFNEIEAENRSYEIWLDNSKHAQEHLG